MDTFSLSISISLCNHSLYAASRKNAARRRRKLAKEANLKKIRNVDKEVLGEKKSKKFVESSPRKQISNGKRKQVNKGLRNNLSRNQLKNDIKKRRGIK